MDLNILNRGFDDEKFLYAGMVLMLVAALFLVPGCAPKPKSRKVRVILTVTMSPPVMILVTKPVMKPVMKAPVKGLQNQPGRSPFSALTEMKLSSR